MIALSKNQIAANCEKGKKRRFYIPTESNILYDVESNKHHKNQLVPLAGFSATDLLLIAIVV